MAKAASEIPRNRILQGHVLDVLKSLPDESVQCCVTSPPYWGLRNYGSQPLVWGGDAACSHDWSVERIRDTRGTEGSTLDNDSHLDANRFDIEWSLCRRCSAWRGDLGMEPRHDCGSWARGESPCSCCYVCHLRLVFGEIRRVLRSDGVFYLNLGDSYTSGDRKYRERGNNTRLHEAQNGLGRPGTPPGLKPKDLCGVPWRTALALQADGWYLRNDNVWAKRNCTPSSVDDRCTVSHEYVFMFSKSDRYFYDSFAVREKAVSEASGNKERFVAGNGERGRMNTHMGSSIPWTNDGGGRNKRTVWAMATEQFSIELCRRCGRAYERKERDALPAENKNGGDKLKVCRCGRSDGWVSHFAVFPRDLAATAVLAGTSEKGCCLDCGTPWRRLVERAKLPRPLPPGRRGRDGGVTNKDGFDRADLSHREVSAWLAENPPRTVGWEPSCECHGRFEEHEIPGDLDGDSERVYVPEIPLEQHSVRRCLVLDPFMGSGTTALMALKASRDFLGIELNEDYIRIAEHRISEEAAQTKLF